MTKPSYPLGVNFNDTTNNPNSYYPYEADPYGSAVWENVTQDKMTAPTIVAGDLVVFVGQFLYVPPSSGAASSINWAHSDLYPKDFNSSGTDISSTTGDWNFWFRTTEGLTQISEDDDLVNRQRRQFVVGVW